MSSQAKYLISILWMQYKAGRPARNWQEKKEQAQAKAREREQRNRKSS